MQIPITSHDLYLIGAACWLFSQIIAKAGTPSWLPAWAVVIVNLIAANWGKSANVEPAQVSVPDLADVDISNPNRACKDQP